MREKHEKMVSVLNKSLDDEERCVNHSLGLILADLPPAWSDLVCSGLSVKSEDVYS